MPASLHYAIACLAKKFFPNMPLWALLLSVDLLDNLILIPMFISLFFGYDFLQTGMILLPWFHGLFMAIIWSVIAMLFVTFISYYHNSKKVEKKNNNSISRNLLNGFIIGFLVFSHWLVDFIGWPMSRDAPGLPLFFDMTQTVGLGLYRNEIFSNIMEYGSYIIIAVFSIYYIFTWIKLKKEKKIFDESKLVLNKLEIES